MRAFDWQAAALGGAHRLGKEAREERPARFQLPSDRGYGPLISPGCFRCRKNLSSLEGKRRSRDESGGETMRFPQQTGEDNKARPLKGRKRGSP